MCQFLFLDRNQMDEFVEHVEFLVVSRWQSLKNTKEYKSVTFNKNLCWKIEARSYFATLHKN